MDIADRIEKALSDILPVYGRTPEFGDDEPEKYAVYSITEKAAEYGDGDWHSTEYLVMITVYTTVLDFPLYGMIKTAMRGEGFSYSSGGQTGTDGLFPYITGYHLEFEGLEDG